MEQPEGSWKKNLKYPIHQICGIEACDTGKNDYGKFCYIYLHVTQTHKILFATK